MFGNLLPINFNPPPTNEAADFAMGARASFPNLITFLPTPFAKSVICGTIASFIVLM